MMKLDLERTRYTFYITAKKKRRLKNVTSFTKIACKPKLVTQCKRSSKEGGFEQILKQVNHDCLYLLDSENSEHFRKIIKRANKLRPYGELKNKLLLEDNLKEQRVANRNVRKYCPVCTVDIGKLMFDYDEEEYSKVAKALNPNH